MEKEALIDIILHDLKEVHTLVSTFKSKQELNAAFINLTRTKVANINEELMLLEQLNTEKVSVASNESGLTSAAPATSIVSDGVAIAESSHRFASGESNEETEVLPSAPEPAQPVVSENDEAPQAMATKPAAVKEEVPVDEVPQESEMPKEEVRPAAEPGEAIVRNEAISTAGVGPDEESPVVATAPKAMVLGEMIKKERSSVNEAMANRQEQVADIKHLGKPVDDVRKALGLNDRFYYQRELFGNNADLFNQTLDQINQMDSYQAALSFLKSNYSWEADNDASESFYKSIQRRFI
ncbi:MULTISPECIES: hypothetical protein [unclassified Carboxylicivirga]|uniref:hypothetical protein n=1 Tax=Carboxylicivirga TaxID=1628153 RepID=UPI003D34750F